MAETPAPATVASASDGTDRPAVPAFSLSVREAWAAYRSDPHWVRKSVLGGLAFLIPLVGTFAVASWLVGYQRRVAWGDDRPLPPVGDYETLAMRALYLFAGTFVWALPLYAVLFGGLVVFFAALGVFVALLATGKFAVAIIGLILSTLVFTLGVSVVGLAYSVVLEAATTRFALYDRLDAFWEVRQILATLRGAWRPLLWAILRIWLISMGVVAAVELVYFGLVLGLGALAVLAFLPAALAGSESVRQGAALFAVGGGLALQMTMWLFQVLLMVALFVAIFPIRAISAHVYGQWARRVYGLDVSDAEAPAA